MFYIMKVKTAGTSETSVPTCYSRERLIPNERNICGRYYERVFEHWKAEQMRAVFTDSTAKRRNWQR